jgi:NTE family protein
MRKPITSRPDALVLGVGGALGIEWLRGVLAGLTDATDIDFRECEYLVGTSAGSVVCAALAAGERPRIDTAGPPPEIDEDVPSASAPGRRAPLSSVGRWSTALAAPVAPTLLRLGAPGGALVRRTALRAGGGSSARRFDGLGRYVGKLDARFDGRLRVVTVDRETGRRVVFGAPGAPVAEVAEAVMASCAIPWVIAPVTINGRQYVDGGLWSPTNIDVVPAGRGTEVLALLPTAAAGFARSPLGAYRALTLAAARAEAMALKARGARVRIVRPDEDSSQAIGPNLMDSSRRSGVLKAAYAQGRRLAVHG